MNIECTKDKLVYAIGKAEKVTSKNITLPVLSCILLEAENSILTIRATNLDIGLEIKIPVKMKEPGIIAVPGTILNNFISSLSDKNITLESKDGNLKITTNQSKSTLKTFSHEDFPTIPKISNEHSIQLNSKNFVKGLKSVFYSSSISSIRPVLGSVMVDSLEDNIVFAATDSFRLAEKKINVKKHKEFNQILIPFKNVGEIIRIFDDYNGDFDVFINQNQISFSYSDFYLTSRIVDGNFPNYEELIPKDIKTEVILLKQDFINNLRISNIFSNKFNQVTFSILPKDKIFRVTTKNADIGESLNNIEAVVKGNELQVSFNYKYIVDCFQSIDSDSVSLSFFDENKPMIIRGVSDKTFTYIVMPMNK